MRRIALLADFPVHTLPGFQVGPSGYHATWLPPVAQALESHTQDLEIHWLVCTKRVRHYHRITHWNQSFHLLPRKKLSVEFLTRSSRERRLLSLKPDLVHAWGTEQGYALAALDYLQEALLSIQGILQIVCKAAAMPLLTRLQAPPPSPVAPLEYSPLAPKPRSSPAFLFGKQAFRREVPPRQTKNSPGRCTAPSGRRAAPAGIGDCRSKSPRSCGVSPQRE